MISINNIIIKIILGVLFLICLFQMPYGYYQLVRFLGTAGFVWLAYIDNNRKEKSLMVLWIVSALLINPFIKIPLGKTIWNIVDIIWAVIFTVTIWADRIKKTTIN